MSELELIERLRQRVPLRHGKLVLGIGDDCAIYRPDNSPNDLLFTTDLMVEGVHFRRSERPANIGFKALARGLSDIAAMGGKPQFCLVSLALPSARMADGFYDGLLKLAERTRTLLAGGDVSRSTKLTVDVVVCGSVPRGKALRRDTASAGDDIYVSGPLGRAASRKYRDRPEPRLTLGRQLLGRATACMDLSDGLSIDLHRLCIASKLAAEVGELPIYRGATIEEALHGGEDYELLFTGVQLAVPGAFRIGQLVHGPPGVVYRNGQVVLPLGHDHFANKD